MHDELVRYFSAEKSESLLFLLAGVGALVASALLVRNGSPYRGMAIPLVIVGLIQVVVGASVYLRTDAQVATLTGLFDGTPTEFQRAELARMAVVMRSFQIYKAIEIVILLGGIVLALLYPHRERLYAAGIGCILQGSLMLVLDLFAEKRGQIYIDAIRRLAGP
ncbi:MAG TPA: hypothetical protein VH877_09460 [Polyangia bacterium]|jgi:hypothetical protein|nr:hypothetical protein [Polyangia bacterium]